VLELVVFIGGADNDPSQKWLVQGCHSGHADKGSGFRLAASFRQFLRGCKAVFFGVEYYPLTATSQNFGRGLFGFVRSSTSDAGKSCIVSRRPDMIMGAWIHDELARQTIP
jgi:hypothetical protein